VYGPSGIVFDVADTTHGDDGVDDRRRGRSDEGRRRRQVCRHDRQPITRAGLVEQEREALVRLAAVGRLDRLGQARAGGASENDPYAPARGSLAYRDRHRKPRPRRERHGRGRRNGYRLRVRDRRSEREERSQTADHPPERCSCITSAPLRKTPARPHDPSTGAMERDLSKRAQAEGARCESAPSLPDVPANASRIDDVDLASPREVGRRPHLGPSERAAEVLGLQLGPVGVGNARSSDAG
jgi:hypothetical protein